MVFVYIVLGIFAVGIITLIFLSIQSQSNNNRR